MTLGPLLCPILVGRDQVLELADRRLGEAGAGHSRFLLLAGEAGIGKSRLLLSIQRRAEARGFAVADGAVAPQDRDVPGSLILDLARWMAKGSTYPALGRDLLRLRDDAVRAPGLERRLFVGDMVERILAAVERPTLLAFEDLQWADDLSLEIVGELARQARDRPILIVGAYRNDEMGPRAVLRDWRSRLLTQRLADEVVLAPLSMDQTAVATTLILNTGLPAPREVVQAVYDRTDGIPLHIEELLGVIGDSARSSSRAIRDADVPDTIEDAVIERISHRSAEAQAVARAGAVIGRCFVPEVLAGIMDLPVAALDAPLQELVDHSVLYPFSQGWFDFRHQLLRDALYRSIPAAQRRRFHARAAEYGANLDGASEVHASVHFECAGLRTQAYRAALAGARTAARLSSHREAFELYRRAVDNAPDDLAAGERARLLEAYGGEAMAIEENALADGVLREARERYLEAGEVAPAAGVLAAIAVLLRRAVRPIHERLEVLRAGLAETEALPKGQERDGVRAQLLIYLAYAEADAYRLADATAHVREGGRLAKAAQNAETVYDAEWVEALIEGLGGAPDTAVAAMSDVATRARAAGSESAGVTAYRQAADLAVRVMDYRGAERLLGEGLRYADSIEQSNCAHIMAATSAMVAWAGGYWDEAIASGEQAVSDRGCRRAATMARWPLGFVALGRGAADRAEEILGAAATIGIESGSPDLILPPAWGRAEAALQAGDARRAFEACEAAHVVASESGERSLFAPFVVTGIRAYHLAGEPDRAEHWLRRCTDLLAGSPMASWPAIDHGRGLIALAAGSTGVARGALEAAVRGWDERGRAWESAWARLDLASCLIRSNRFAEASALVSDVAATAMQLGSPPLTARAEELARQVRGRGSADEPWRPLTAREFEVARLIRDGLTNGEIGGELGIATKTVSAHVEHILAKLGVARRAEVAAWVASVTRSRSAATTEAVGVGRR